MKGSPFTPSKKDLPDGTSALFVLGEGAEQTAPRCSAAVKHWQKGYSIFKQNPPVDRKVEFEGMSPEGVSFVTLYNPTDGAEGECVVAACTERPKTGNGQDVGDDADNEDDDDDNEDDEAGEKKKLKAQSRSKMVSALLCATTPVAFDNNPLFTRDQWDKIAKANSASTAMASLLTSAALLAAVLLL
ncbi:hypothetical protein ACSSS7_005346 [Eimeria intestinalis]